jgi:hypothetical protein
MLGGQYERGIYIILRWDICCAFEAFQCSFWKMCFELGNRKVLIIYLHLIHLY